MDNFTPLIVIPVVLVILFLFRRRRAAPADKAKKLNTRVETAKAIVSELENAGYYKYADAKDAPTLKTAMIKGFTGDSVLTTVYNGKYNTSLDYRLYSLDGEDLFEEGGFTSALKDMQPLFDKIGLQVDITDHTEKMSEDDLLNHSITINSKRYIIFRAFNDYGWDEAAQRYAEIINDQLALQNKDERLYLISGGNQGRAVFLTEPQFTLIDNLLKDEREKPLTVKDWCRVFDVDPTKYLGKR